jgi:tetratricopeptide (TPR) repeat protein
VKFLADYSEHGYQRGDPEGSVGVARLAVKACPRNPDAWLLLARSQRDIADESSVQSTLEGGVRRTHDSAQLQYELVKSLLSQEKIDAATRIISSMISRATDRLWIDLANAKVAFYQRDYDDMENHIDAAIMTAPSDRLADVLREAGFMQQEAGREDQAVSLLTRAVDVRDHWGARITLAILLEDRDNALSKEHLQRARSMWEGSEEDFQEVVRIVRGTSPESPGDRSS